MKRELDNALRKEIAWLGELLGETIRDISGAEALNTIETIRRMSRDRRGGDRDADERLSSLIASLDEEQMRIVIRAFTVFLDLANLAEDRQRVRVLQTRARHAEGVAIGESVEAALAQLKEAGKSAVDVQRLLDQLRIELVFTAHPTEAKRRSIRAKLRQIRTLLYASDKALPPVEADRNEQFLRTELTKLWLTDFIRPWRPTVLQEVQRGLSITPVLWDVTPRITRDMREGLARVYPDDSFDVRPCIAFDSWIGGDRDGHPFVTTSVTEQTILWLRQTALESQLSACRSLIDSFSVSKRQMAIGEPLEKHISQAMVDWPQLESQLQTISHDEVPRRWLSVMRWRLEQTQRIDLEERVAPGAYQRAGELDDDLSLLIDSIQDATAGPRLTEELVNWRDQVRAFGFQLARLDLRQDAEKYVQAINELFENAGVCPDPVAIDEAERQRLLVATLDERLEWSASELSEETCETLALFEFVHRTNRAFGSSALGGHVISMTHTPSDVITVLWLLRQTAPPTALDSPATDVLLPIIPLFETIDDLQRAPQVLDALLRIDVYRAYLRRQQDRQIVMLGYSDSTKDGGYLSACWSLYESQLKLHEIATRHGVRLTFFHGRGGSLGRGGGPAARGILSLPRDTFQGSLRLTEQGEVLADRYDDPRIAHRHLDQILWSSLLACGMPAGEIPAHWFETMRQLADKSFHAYRELVEQPGFVDFFRRATPIAEIEQLPIGSRPARRRAGSGLSDLRAIPWVFSWTQSRCLIPAWYGLGTAMSDLLDDARASEKLRAMYHEWSFFRATIDNAELALAKTDLGIAERYAKLADDTEALVRIGQMMSVEFTRANRAILATTGNEALLDGTPWLQESIRVRNRYIDPLNLIQVDLLRRLQACDSDGSDDGHDELRHLTRLTVKGIAAGLRTSG